MTFLFGVALAVGLGDLILSLVPRPGRTVTYELIVCAGVVLVGGGAVVWIRRRTLVSTEGSDERPQRRRPAALIGGRPRGTGAADRLSLLRSDRDDRRLRHVERRQAVLLVLYCVIYVLPLIAIAAVIAIMGERAETHPRPVVRGCPLTGRCIVAPLTAALGTGVLAFGIVQLSST